MRILTEFLFIVFLAVTVLTGCKDKGPGPKQVEYVLYAGIIRSVEGYVAIIDCETDSIIDSVFHGFGTAVGVSASPDGRFFGTQSGAQPPVLIWDAASRSPVAELPRFIEAFVPLFLPDAGLIMTPDRGETRIYRMPDFELDTILTQELSGAKRIPGTHRVVGRQRRNDGPPWDDSKLAVFDYTIYREVDSVIINPDGNGVGLQIGSIDFSPDGKVLYAVGSRPEAGIGVSIAAYDLQANTLIYLRPVRTGGYGMVVTPDGQEIWTAYPGPAAYDRPAKTIDIWDAATGTLIDSVLLTGFREESQLSLAANFIEFEPTGKKAYVACGGTYRPKGPQPLLVIDIKKREVIRLLFPEFDQMALIMDIAPKP